VQRCKGGAEGVHRGCRGEEVLSRVQRY